MRVFAVIVTWLLLVSSGSVLLAMAGWVFIACAAARYVSTRK